VQEGFQSAETTVALALAAGIVAQSLARHMRVPGIVVLLGVGVLLGPDVMGAIDPDLMGEALLSLVGFAVAVILFEGGMNLDLRRLRRENRAIRQLVILGSLVTLGGAALCARLVLDWSWRHAVLFGTLVIVTGPTVITPLLRRFRVERQVATVLEAEGVLIDAVGAVIAIVALEMALHPSGTQLALGVASVPLTLAAGAALGVAGGFLLSGVLAVRNLVPEGLENVFTLSLVLALYQSSNGIIPESGIAAATVAGIIVGNRRTHAYRELLEFKEQLTVMFIGMLFVLLAADVRMAELRALGAPGLVVVLLLMLVVRPLNVLVGTYGTELDVRQKAFLSAIGPRGIVAAAIAALFAAELERSGEGGGTELRALVFLTIVVTVVVAGVSGGLLARLLGLSRPANRGWIILGANELSRAMAHALSRGGEEAVCIDTNPALSETAQREGLRVIYGNALRGSTLARAEIDTRRGALALSPNTEVNLLFMRRVHEEARLKSVYVAAGRSRFGTSHSMIEKAGAQLLFGTPEQLDMWVVRLRRRIAHPVRWTVVDAKPLGGEHLPFEGAPEGALLPLTVTRGSNTRPVGARLELAQGDTVELLMLDERQEQVERWMREHGMTPAPQQPEVISDRSPAPSEAAQAAPESPPPDA
jgi:NhaP-type Na+/H+ or K+/H+ antiporter